MPVPIVFLITDLDLGGSPIMLRDLALGLAGIPNRMENRKSALPASRKPPFAPSIISLKPLPSAEITTPNSSAQSLPDAASDDGDHSFPSIPEQLRAAGIPVHSLNLSRPADIFRAVPRLARSLGSLRPAILYSILVHANALATLTMPLIKNKPIFIQSIHTLQPAPAWHWTLQGILAPCADAIVAPAEPILQKIAQHGPFQRGIVIPNGIDIERFARAAPLPAAQLPWPPDARVIGYVGRFDPVKNLPLLLRAFAKLLHLPPLPPKARDFSDETGEKDAQTSIKTPENPPKTGEIHLALVGYGVETERLQRLAKAFGIASRVHFLGPTTMPERWYKSFTCHCLPSTVEGFGMTLVEALAAGIPVVAVRTAVTAAIVGENRRARLIDRPDEMLLANAIKQVMAVPSEASQNIREEEEDGGGGVGRYSVREMVAMHERIFADFSRF